MGSITYVFIEKYEKTFRILLLPEAMPVSVKQFSGGTTLVSVEEFVEFTTICVFVILAKGDINNLHPNILYFRMNVCNILK